MSGVVLVTDACGEIGAALCQRCVREGDTVVARDADADGLVRRRASWDRGRSRRSSPIPNDRFGRRSSRW